MQIKAHTSLWPLAVMVLVLAVLFGSLVTAGPGHVPSGQEADQADNSWPHGVTIPNTTVKAFDRLVQIHEFALGKLRDAEPHVDKEPILEVLRKAFVCVAYDGKQAVPAVTPPVPPHVLQHLGAAAEIEAAWNALNEPVPNWSLCASKLEHGHEE